MSTEPAPSPGAAPALQIALCVAAIGEDDVEGAMEERRDAIEAVDLVALAAEKVGGWG